MAYYAALDVSTESTSIRIVDREGVIVHEGKAATEPGAIREFLQSAGLPLSASVLKLGACPFGSITTFLRLACRWSAWKRATRTQCSRRRRSRPTATMPEGWRKLCGPARTKPFTSKAMRARSCACCANPHAWASTLAKKPRLSLLAFYTRRQRSGADCTDVVPMRVFRAQLGIFGLF